MNLQGLLKEDTNELYQIYQDMDGCLCDFNARFEHFSGMTPEEYKITAEEQFGEKIGKERFWSLIDEQVGVRFWRGMSWMPEGRELWDYVKKFNPIILTAPSRNKVSIIGKNLWVKDNLGENIPIEFKSANSKSDFAGPNQILIDDRLDTILDWKSKNGIGILYEGNTKDVIKELKKLGL